MRTQLMRTQLLLLLVTWHLVSGAALAATFAVTNTANSGAGSLRQALLNANASPGSTIRFAIPASALANGVATIKPASELPVVTANGTVIDGNTQTSAIGNTNASGPEVVLDGSLIPDAAASIEGLDITAGSCLVRGLVIQGFYDTCLRLSGTAASGNKVQGCYIATNATGTTKINAPNNAAPDLSIEGGATNNLIGGAAASYRNIISGVLQIAGSGTNGNLVQGNYIGVDRTGTVNLGSLISIGSNAQNNVIGGSSAARNVIAGQGSAEVSISGGGTKGNRVQSNAIGLNAAGTVALSSADEGVFIGFGAQNNTVGGVLSAAEGSTGAGNVIAGHAGVTQYLIQAPQPRAGIRIYGSGTSGNQVQGNMIGLNAAGTAAVRNSIGVHVHYSASNNTIGGTLAAARNVISGNASGASDLYCGIQLGTDISETGDPNLPPVTANTVVGNYIGTRPAGDAALGNDIGVYIGKTAHNNTIGGAGGGTRNVISGNRQHGIEVVGDNNTILGNFIGVQASGASAQGNLQRGIYIKSATGTVVGDTGAGAGNRIAYNGGDGVHVEGACVGYGGCDTEAENTRNPIRGNSIYNNGKLGIDLCIANTVSGVTANDATDADFGPNGLQNYPVLSQAMVQSNGSTTIKGSLTSRVDTSYALDFYASPTPDPTNDGEGKTYIGSLTITIPNLGSSSGTKAFTATLGGDYAGQYITATATEVQRSPGATSEFSKAIKAVRAKLTLTVAPSTFRETAGANAATATVTRNTPTTSSLTVTLSSNDTTEAVPAVTSLTIPAGAASATFQVKAIDDTVADGSQYVVFSASATGLSTGIAVVTVTDNEASASTAAASTATAPSAPATLAGVVAFVSGQSVQLTFSGALDTTAASDVLSYTVTVNGFGVAASAASYDAQTNTVTLLLPDGALHDGDAVIVSWGSGSVRLTAE